MAMKDVAAAERLRREVHRQYEAHHKARFTKSGLATATGCSRPALDNWLEQGQMPKAEGMAALASGIGVQPAYLWVKWLGIATSDPLVRIADALDRAYPPDPDPLDVAAEERAASAERRHRAEPTGGASEEPPAPPATMGSGR